MAKAKAGEVIYKIDINNDKDFFDEAEFKAMKLDWKKLDSLSQYAHHIHAETYVQGEIKTIKVPVLILNSKYGMNLNFPQYARTGFQGNTINISSEFGDIAFRLSSLICQDGSIDKKSENLIEKNEFITIDGNVFLNMGVDYSNQELVLKKMPSDSILFSTQVGFNAKAFSGKDFISHDSINLQDYLGKYLFLEFWGTWCAPCIEELPNLKYVYENTDRSKIEFLGIAEDSFKSLKEYLEKDSIPWSQIISEQDNNLVEEYGIISFPTSFLINEKGEIIAKNLRGENLLDTLNFYVK